MSRSLVYFRTLVRLGLPLAIGWLIVVLTATSVFADDTKPDPRLKGLRAPKGFKVRVVAAEPTLLDPSAMAFDDQGNLFVAERRPGEWTIETWDVLKLPEGGTTRVRRSRKNSTDVVKRLKDVDGDGVYESSEIAIEGCELPTAMLPWKNCLFLACAGRLEKWSDEDADGKFETRAILADGFSAIDGRQLSGITLGADGWLYLTTGDHDNRIVGSDDSRVDLLRNGGVVRCKLDGSRMSLFAMGLRNPRSALAFDSSFHPSVIDGDQEDGSKFQGTRLIQPVEEADYGWRVREGEKENLADFDRAAAHGEKPGKLGPLARVGRGSPSGLVIFNGDTFPASFRDLRIEADPSKQSVRGLKIENRAGYDSFTGETTLLASDDDQFHPCQVVIGADGAFYVLERHGRWSDHSTAVGDGKAGRIYQLRWDGDSATPAKPLKPNNWKRIFDADANQLVFQFMASPDFQEADRALRELVERGPANLPYLLGYATNTSASLHPRLLGILGARVLWNEAIENVMIALLNDPEPEVRRLAAQALAVEPKGSAGRLVAKLTPHLDDSDPRVVREVVLAIGRHGESRAQQNAAVLLRWLYAHPQSNPIVKDGFLRALERLGDAGVEEVALAIRTRSGVERETAVTLFAGLRSTSAAERLDDLVKIPDLTASERVGLIRQFQDFPAGVPLPTQGLADWVAKHGDLEPAEKIAALDACRLAGNPASTLVLALLDDDDESVRQAAIGLAAFSRPPKALEKLENRLTDKATSDSERLLLARSLGAFGPKAFPSLESAYRTSDDLAVRQATLRSMATANRVKATPELQKALSGNEPAIRSLAVGLLGESSAGTEILGRAFLERSIGRADLPIVLTSLRKHESANNRKLLAAIEDDATRGSDAINPAEIRSKLAQSSDPWAGMGLFFRESSRCSSCHTVEGRGIDLGPSLTIGTATPSPDHLLDSILHPSREIALAHATTRVTLKDGRSFVGIVQSKDARSIQLREASGRDLKIATELIAEALTEPNSLMPSTIGLEFTPDELAQLMAFLLSKPTQSTLKNGPKRLDRVLTIGPFALGADRLRIPLDRVDPVRILPGQDGHPATWSVQEATSWGTLNLRGSLGSKPGRAYLAVQIRSERDQVATLRFGFEGASRIYLNGSRIADVAEHDPAVLVHAFDRPREGSMAGLPDLAKLPLKSGWNLLIIGLDRTGFGDARAALEVFAAEPIEFRLPGN